MNYSADRGWPAVAEIRAKTKARKESADIGAEGDFVAEVGRLVRLARAKRGMTRRQLAADSGASERYLAQIEGGQGNPSVIILESIAHVLDLLGRLPPAELPAVAELIEGRLAQGAASDRGRRIALVGLRGAGKSTLGRRLADALGCPFIELDRLVEQDYGARIPDLIEMAGIATFRRYERACLERVIDEHRAAVVATAGGIVSNPETYALLLRRTHTVWVKARPDEHMRRVMEQSCVKLARIVASCSGGGKR